MRNFVRNRRLFIVLFLASFSWLGNVLNAQEFPCDEQIFNTDQITLQASDCTSDAQLCISVPFANFSDYFFYVDGVSYAGDLNACEYDTVHAFSYATLFGTGNTGPYHLDEWMINGVNITGTFQDIAELVTLMNNNDPGGNWVDRPNSNLIVGGVVGNTYSVMEVTVVSINTPSFIGFNIGLEAQGTGIDLSVGIHNVFILDNVNQCQDTVMVIVECDSNCEVIVEVIDQASAPLPYLIAENIAGLAPFTYMWSSGELTGGIFPSSSGTYCVTMTDVNGCEAVSCETVTLNPPEDCNAMINVDDNSNIATTNNIGSNATPVAWQWQNGSTENNTVITTAGQFCVTVTYDDGCISESCTYYVPTQPCDIFMEQYILPNGEVGIIAVPSGGAGSFSFLWNTSETTNEIIVNQSGNYCVIIADQANCYTEMCVDVTVNLPVDTLCTVEIVEFTNTSGDVGLQVVAESGVAPYTYQWSDGQLGSMINVADSGTYCVTMTDADGCSAEDCALITINPPNDSCTTSIVVDTTTTGLVLATNNYTSNALPTSWEWNTGETTNYLIVSQAGTYCVTVTYDNGCTAADCFSYDPNTNGQDTLCYIDLMEFTTASGEISLGVDFQTGVEPYTYNWSNGQLGSSIIPNANGQYCVTMTDAVGCYATDCINVIVTPVPDSCSTTITVDTTSVAITLGTANYGSNAIPVNWLWDNGATTSEITIAQAGNYCVTVTYADGCFDADCYTYVGANECSLDFSQTNTGTGYVHINTINQTGVAPYSYSWDFGVIGNLVTVTESGTYCVTMTDAVGCQATNCAVVVMESCSTEIHVEETNNGANLYTIDAPNTNPAVDWYWSTGETDDIISVVDPGTYCVTVTHDDGCESTDCYQYTPNPIDTLCHIDIAEFTTATGTVALEVIGQSGTTPFTYQWSNGQIGSEITVIESGIYCVTMTDANGCVAEDCANVTINPPVVDTCNTTIVVDTTTTGLVLATNNYTSNALPVSWEWSTGETTNYLIVSQSGNYCVTVTYDDGCYSADCFIYDPNNGGPDTLCHIDIAEFTTATGLIGLEIISQSGTAPYSYQWSNGQIGSEIMVTDSGMYCVTMTDDDGCYAEDCITVTVAPPIDTCDVFIIGNTNPNGVFVLEAAWASNDLPTLMWTTGQNTTTINVVDDGTYCVTATFLNGCVATACYDYVSNPVDTSCFVYITEEVSASGMNLVFANATGAGPFAYLWSNGSTLPAIVSAPATYYCVTMTDVNGCTSSDCYTTNEAEVLDKIDGYVWSDSIPGINSGFVYLIQFDPIDSTLTAIDTTSFSSTALGGYYSFENLNPGSYLVKAALNENSSGYQSHLPTYHFDELFWNEAEEITIPQVGTAQLFNIAMVQGNNPGGPGFIGGYVTEGANKPDNTITDSKSPGDPMPNVSVLLLDENDNPITHTVTDEEGRYEFDDLPYGTYKVFVEITGKDQGMQQVTLSPNTPEFNQINFNVNSTFTTTAISEINEVKSIQLFPNPVAENGVLNLAIEMTTFEELTVEIISVNGNQLFSSQENVSTGVNIIQLDTNILNSGVYFLNVKSSNGVMTRKFIR